MIPVKNKISLRKALLLATLAASIAGTNDPNRRRQLEGRLIEVAENLGEHEEPLLQLKHRLGAGPESRERNSIAAPRSGDLPDMDRGLHATAEG
ncbi:MAG: hypothetical protein PHY77_04530 [Desulfotomaculaceae bacterium]|nr:hypothetical protein [Desulfotomaculaceae bacterium]